MKRLFFILLASLFSLALTAQDQTDPAAVLEYYGDDLELAVFDIDGNEIEELFFGMELMPGDRVKTSGTTAEIRLDPNGTIIKLSYDTEFTIEALQTDEQSANEFTLFGGKIRTIAAKLGIFQRNNYSIQTPTAVAGVRGTDFGLQVIPDEIDSAFVFEGNIEYTNLNSGQSLNLGAGQFADVFADSFQAVALSAEQFAAIYQDLQFEGLSPADVPGYQAPVVEEPQESEPEPEPEPELSEQPAPEDDPVMNFLAEYLGLQIGTLTIDGITFSKLILGPTFEIGKFDIALYLPVIYNTNVFDPDDWYQPEGNNEWSFGSDQDTVAEAAEDALKDLVLKIRYIEYGDNRDPFFLKVGNVNGITLGHGILMNRFANDTDFPAIRRVGLNTGFNADKVTVESVFNDLAEPEIIGARLGFRPFGRVFPLGFGASSVVDTDPAGDLDDDLGSPIFVNGALDTEFPLIERDALSIVGFADIGALFPYWREDYTLGPYTVEAGWQDTYVYNPEGGSGLEALRNYGYSAGIFGNLSFIDYRLEYQYGNGTFFNGFYGPTYERQRELYAAALFASIESGSADDYDPEDIRGIYGQAGFSWEELLTVEAGYRYAWDEDGFNDEADLFHLMATVPKIPFVGLSASLGMDTIGFVDGIQNESLFDERTSLYGEVVYPLSPVLKLAAVVNNIVIEEEDGTKDATFSVSIETRVSF